MEKFYLSQTINGVLLNALHYYSIKITIKDETSSYVFRIQTNIVLKVKEHLGIKRLLFKRVTRERSKL